MEKWLCVCLCPSLNTLVCVPRCFVNGSLCLYCVSCFFLCALFVWPVWRVNSLLQYESGSFEYDKLKKLVAPFKIVT